MADINKFRAVNEGQQTLQRHNKFLKYNKGICMKLDYSWMQLGPEQGLWPSTARARARKNLKANWENNRDNFIYCSAALWKIVKICEQMLSIWKKSKKTGIKIKEFGSVK